MENKKEMYNKGSKNKESINKETKKVETEVKETPKQYNTDTEKEQKIKQIKDHINKLDEFIKKSNNSVQCALCLDRKRQLRQMIKELECGKIEQEIKSINNVPSISNNKVQNEVELIRGQITNTGEVFEML